MEGTLSYSVCCPLTPMVCIYVHNNEFLKNIKGVLQRLQATVEFVLRQPQELHVLSRVFSFVLFFVQISLFYLRQLPIFG